MKFLLIGICLMLMGCATSVETEYGKPSWEHFKDHELATSDREADKAICARLVIDSLPQENRNVILLLSGQKLMDKCMLDKGYNKFSRYDSHFVN